MAGAQIQEIGLDLTLKLSMSLLGYCHCRQRLGRWLVAVGTRWLWMKVDMFFLRVMARKGS